MKELGKAAFKAEVEESGKPVLVDFWASWCGPCRMMAPVLEELEAEYEDSISFGKVNIDDEPELAQEYGIISIPTLILFKDGRAAEQCVGAVPKARLAEMLEHA